MNEPVSELYAEIAQWADAKGASKLNEHPGLWRGETSKWTVEINGHDEVIDGLPFATARLTHKVLFQLAVLSPFSGAIGGGADEGKMIEHFRSERERITRTGADK